MDTVSTSGAPGWKYSAAAAITCVSIAGISFGLGLPLLAFNLEFMTHSGWIIGLNAFMAALSTVIAAPFAPAILARVPTRPFMIACVLVAALSFISYPLIRNVPFWMAMRLFSGAAIAILFVASETWVNQLAPARIRGRVIGIYSMSLAAGFGLGGLIVAFVGVRGWAPFLAGAGFCLLAIIPLFLPGPGLVIPERTKSGIQSIINMARTAPRLMMGGFAFGAIETAAMHFSPVWAFRAGYSETMAQLVVAAGAFGVIALQLPISWLGDHFDRYKLLMACALVALIGPVLMYLAATTHSPLIYVIFFFYVGVTEGLYILAMALIGQRFSATNMTAANATLVTFYGLGSLLSPMLVGGLMQQINPHGAMIGLFIIGLVYPVIAVLRSARRAG